MCSANGDIAKSESENLYLRKKRSGWFIKAAVHLTLQSICSINMAGLFDVSECSQQLWLCHHFRSRFAPTDSPREMGNDNGRSFIIIYSLLLFFTL